MQDVDLAELPRLTALDLRLLWVHDWYDGRLAAIVEHESGRGSRCTGSSSTSPTRRGRKRTRGTRFAKRRPRVLGEPLGWVDEMPRRSAAADVTA